jgi:NAD(P)-dependent dehydrogenase (short-subunit alcohol dehydrogenase family)
LSQSNIRVNAIAPGFFSTTQNRFLLFERNSNTLTSRGNNIISQTPMGEFGNAEDLKGAVLYLASQEQSRFVTGIVLPVDGGFSAYSGV